MAVYLYQVRCNATGEVYYGVRTESINSFYNRLRRPTDTTSKLAKALLQYGIDNFTIDQIGTYLNQTQPVQRGNKLIAKAMREGKELNSDFLRVSKKRSAPIF